ncbi:hypothetical protein KW800_02385 [Candidatus Parcubacteria bacterium]|nr:hypothetical protein [Candidatus Parcubacteria bacterium]
MKYVILTTAGLIVLFFGVYYGFRFTHKSTHESTQQGVEGGVTNTDTGNVKGWQVYTDPTGTVSIKHPTEAEIKTPPTGLTQEWRVDATTPKGTLLVDIRIPKSYMPGTNFSEARFTVGRSADAAEIKNCAVVHDNFTDKSTVTISGYQFTKFNQSDAAAGNRYDSTVYHGIFDGDCYAIEYTIHSTNIGNYPPELGVKEFDKGKIEDTLEQMAESVKWNISSN